MALCEKACICVITLGPISDSLNAMTLASAAPPTPVRLFSRAKQPESPHTVPCASCAAPYDLALCAQHHLPLFS